MKYDIEVDSGAMIYVPSFIKNGSGIQRLIGGYIYIHIRYVDRISLLLFHQNKGSRLKTII
jgi:hypothetical protein